MITKEKLIDLKHEHFNQHTGSYFDVDSMLRKIYDSIGSCGECKKADDFCFLLSINHNYMRKDTFFCADFERKEPCGT